MALFGDDQPTAFTDDAPRMMIFKPHEIADKLEQAFIENNFELRRMSYYNLLDPSTFYALGEEEYLAISKRFQMKTGREYLETKRVIRSSVARVSRPSVVALADQPLLNFVEYVDNAVLRSPLDVCRVLEGTLVNVLRWAYSDKQRLALYEIETFLLSENALKIFNIYQLHHLSQRFDLPRLRMQCLSGLRTLSDIEDFKADMRYYTQLSMVDHNFIERREAKIQAKIIDFDYDERNGCTFLHSIYARYSTYAAFACENGPHEDCAGFSEPLIGLF